MFARNITFDEELFDEVGSFEKAFLLFFLFAGIIAFYDELFDTGGSLESSFCRFRRAHYHVLC